MRQRYRLRGRFRLTERRNGKAQQRRRHLFHGNMSFHILIPVTNVEKFRNFSLIAKAIESDADMNEPEPIAKSRIRDKDLLGRFRGGDRDAFTVLYRGHSPAVYRFALLMTGDEVKAADVTQDVFVWLLDHSAKFDPERGELGSFLTGVTRKFLQRRGGEERRWMPLEDVFAAVDGDRERDAESDADMLRRAIAALPATYREVVVRCDLEGRSYEETAALMECAVGTVRSRLHRARALLSRKLEPERKAERCAI